MLLSKALKYKNSIVNEINDLKEKIKKHNSYIDGNVSSQNYDVDEAINKLDKLTNVLINLKIAINNANIDIYPLIFSISEYKSQIVFYKELDCSEGTKLSGYSENAHSYRTHVSESTRDSKVNELQKLVDSLQDEIDKHNLTTEFIWDIEE